MTGASDAVDATGDRSSRAAATPDRRGQPGLPALPRTAWLAIDLDAVVSNLRVIRESLPAGVRVEPVVKGDAYGHGSVQVSRALATAGAEGFCVATYDEALELRQAGIGQPILVLYPIPPELVPNALRHRFALTIGDATLLARSLEALDGAPPDRRRLRLHVEVETGLGRGGVPPEDVPEIVAAIEAHRRARLSGLWSHLQAPHDAPRTAGQTERFEAARLLLEEVRLRVPMRHLSASGGVLAASAPEFDAVRVGLALYGIVPDGLDVSPARQALAERLRPAMSLHARPVRVARLQAGTGVSYGPSFVTSRDSRIATLPLGYADGYPRSLSNRAQALVRGVRVPMAGTVAMDAVMADVTDIPGDEVTVDDEFVLLGGQGDDQILATEVARWGNTISWEVVTAMSRRLTRVYYAAGKPVAVRALAEERGGWIKTERPSASPRQGPASTATGGAGSETVRG